MTRVIMALTIVVLLFSAPASQGAGGDDRPNIILFVVDDLGWQDTSVPFWRETTEFNKRYRTPHLEALAARGVRFTDAYASAPVCTPTRTSIMTGRSPARTRITYWTLHKDQDTTRQHPLLRPPAWNMNGLRTDDVTLPRLLRRAGYRTIHVGKAHFGAHNTSGADPRNLGFEVNVAGHASGAPGSYYGTHQFTQVGRQGGEAESSFSVWDVPGLELYHDRDIFLTEALAIEASNEIRAALNRDQPFFMNFAPYAVHAPIMANKRYLDHYADLHPREKAYATMIETVDAALGSLIETLEEAGALSETIIVFTSDNGGLSAHARGGLPHTHNFPLRSGKGSAYEGGVRVPTVVAWPGIVQEGTMNDSPVITHDLFPTILAMAGVGVPEDHRATLDGVDLTPLLRSGGSSGENDPSAERALIWHMPHTWGARGPGIAPYSAIREGDWKLIYFHAERSFELYNLSNDIHETTDLSEFRPEITHRLAKHLADFLRERGAQMSIDRATGEPIEWPDAALITELP